MVIEDFKTLPVPEQWYEIWEYGKPLVTLDTAYCKLTLYALFDFYVEVQSDPDTRMIIRNNAFNDSRRINKYIKDFEVDVS